MKLEPMMQRVRNRNRLCHIKEQIKKQTNQMYSFLPHLNISKIKPSLHERELHETSKELWIVQITYPIRLSNVERCPLKRTSAFEQIFRRIFFQNTSAQRY